MLWMTTSASAILVTDTLFNRADYEETFAFGADVSFVPQMEGWGTKWLDKNGKQKDILQILKEQGINAIRLRVWTVASGASSKGQVVNMCKRAKAKGMSVMIDFHYSDTWADPGSQTIPSAWTDHSVEALSKNIYDHTYDVLSAIKAAGVVPKWVQVGNETKRGMLYPVGQTNKGGSVAFAKFVQSGYDAVKAVDSTMQVIVHLPDGHDNSLYRSIFDGLKKNGAKWDIIGLSAYPRWSHLDGPTMITRVMSNIKDLKTRYKTPCMVVETGHYPSEALAGNQYLAGVMNQMIKNGDLGCFYWEPESMGGYDMGAWDESTRKPTIMMDAYLGVKYTEVSWLMNVKLKTPTNEQTVVGDLLLTADVRHIRKRTKSVTFFLDRKQVGTSTETPYEQTIEAPEPGIHQAWVKAEDTDKNTQFSDTVTFFTGESVLLTTPVLTDETQKGGRACWKVNFKEGGKYRLLAKYSSPAMRGVEVYLGADSIARTYFYKRTDEYQKLDIEVKEVGEKELVFVATSSTGLPEVEWLRVFPLEGQAVALGEQTEVEAIYDEEWVEVYSLSGMRLCRAQLSQLGVLPFAGASKVVTLSSSLMNCLGGIPYILRKQRLK